MRKILRNVGGHDVELEERDCEGGCGKKFYVMEGSGHKYARSNCRSVCNNLFLSFKEEISEKSDKKKGLNLDTQRDQVKIKWLLNIEKVKDLMKVPKYWEQHRMDIADLAIEVTFSKFDPIERKKLLRGFNLANFSLATGVDHRTLGMWVNVKKNVVNKLNKGSYKHDMFVIAKATLKRITRDSDSKKVKSVFKEETEKYNERMGRS